MSAGAGSGGQGDVAALREHLHGMWAGVADRWAEHADDVDERGAAVTALMLDRADARPGDRVLELACGPGGAGLAAVERVGPGGEVVLSDVVPAMAEIARARAAARGIANVRTLVLDLEQIDQPDASYDVVLCREGLMFAVEPERAVAEIRRVLRPGGRVAVAVWAAQDVNPWLGVVLDAVSEQLGSPMPPPGIPGPFALGDAGRVEALLAGAGFAAVVVEQAAMPLRLPSFDAYWTRTSAIAGPLATILAIIPEEARDAIVAKVRDGVAPYTSADGALDLPGVTLLASARRP